MFTVEKAIPIPPPRRPGRVSKYPFEGMNAGDSFAVPLAAELSEKTAIQRLLGAATAWAKRKPSTAKFTARIVKENDIQMVRIWVK